MRDSAPTGCTFSSILQTMAPPSLGESRFSRREAGQAKHSIEDQRPFWAAWSGNPADGCIQQSEPGILRKRANSLGGKT